MLLQRERILEGWGGGGCYCGAGDGRKDLGVEGVRDEMR